LAGGRRAGRRSYRMTAPAARRATREIQHRSAFGRPERLWMNRTKPLTHQID
jgi:hypothetical protein